MRRLIIFTTLICIFVMSAKPQLVIDNASFTIQSGATVTVQGDVTSNVDILGAGLLQLKGSSLQNVSMNGFTIPNLELDNTAHATLTGNARIGTNMLFSNGKFQTGNFNLLLASASTINGANSSRFFWTNETGQVIKQLTADVAAFEFPVGENNNYRPAYLTTTGNNFASAQFGVRVLGTADANKPPMIASYLNTNWPVTRSGITGGTVSLSGQYIDPADISGTEANLVGYYNNGTDWSSVGETHNASTNLVGALVSTASGVVSGMNKYLVVGARAFLQGAYNSGTGLMADNLRTLPFGSSASTDNFPSTDPYRVAPYNTFFAHTNNTPVETIPNAAVLDPGGINDDIVDWVFLELRNLDASPGNVILQTRAALIQRDGDITDVDGVSPVTFNGFANSNYILTVRHRNHLGLSIDQSSPMALNETRSTAFTTNLIDFRIATDPQLFGTSGSAYTTAAHPSLTTVNLLWGGDVSGNSIVRYQGSNGPTGPNDRVVLLQSLGGIESTVLSGYFRGDINLNGIMRYQGSNGPSGPNDRVVLLQILGNNEATIRIQSIVN